MEEIAMCHSDEGGFVGEGKGIFDEEEEEDRIGDVKLIQNEISGLNTVGELVMWAWQREEPLLLKIFIYLWRLISYLVL